MKLKMLTRMAAMVAAGSLVVGLLAGCSVIPSKDGAADSAVGHRYRPHPYAGRWYACANQR